MALSPTASTMGASLLLAAMLIPMTLAQPSSMTMPIATSTLATASTTLFPESAAYPSQTLAFDQKDRPQSWLYRSASWRLSAHPMMMVMTLRIMGCYFIPAVAAFVVAKGAGERSDTPSTITDAVVGIPTIPTAETANAAKKAAQTDLHPIWVTYYSTTTTFLPAVTVTAPPLEVTGTSASHVHLAGGGGDFLIPLPPVVELPSTCTEKDPAVYPIIEGRKASITSHVHLAGDAGSFIIPLPPVVELPPTCTEKDQALCPIVEGRRTALAAL